MTNQEQANRLIQEANEHHRLKRYEPAIEAYRKAMALFPAYRAFGVVVGDMLFELKRYAEAAEAYQEVVALTPGHDEAWSRLGQCRMMLNQLPQAAEAFDTAVKANDSAAEALFYGAMVWVRLNDHNKARAYLHRALALRPDWTSRAREDVLLKTVLA